MNTIPALTRENTQRSTTWLTLDDAQIQDENRLMLDARDHPEAFEAVYQRYSRPIYAYIRRRTGTREEAEDLTSQVFMRALEALHLYRGGIVAAWLFAIARNVLASYYRRKKYPAISIEDGELPDDDAGILERIEAAENRQMVARLLDGLTPESRDILTMSLYQELSSHDIGARLNMSPITVRTRLHRMMKSLRARYITLTGLESLN